MICAFEKIKLRIAFMHLFKDAHFFLVTWILKDRQIREILNQKIQMLANNYVISGLISDVNKDLSKLKCINL